MNLEVIFIAISLSADAFAVTISNALSYPKDKRLKFAPLYFGVFQMLMPIIGYFLGNMFYEKIAKVDNIIIFILLSLIGAKMIFEAFSKDDSSAPKELSHKVLFFEAIATSIDALAIGVSFSLMGQNIFTSSLIIGLITYLICFIALKLCSKISDKYTSKFEIFGGVILILIGLKSLIF